MKYAWQNSDFGVPGQVGGIATLNDYPYTDFDGGTPDTCKAPSVNATIFLEEPKILSKFVALVICS